MPQIWLGKTAQGRDPEAVHEGNPFPVTDVSAPTHLAAFAQEAITVATTAVGFTTATYRLSVSRSATHVTLGLATAQIRYRVDGTDPTSSAGRLMEIGDEVVVTGREDIDRFRAIRTGGVSGALTATYSEEVL
jgi:hypothetical protein